MNVMSLQLINLNQNIRKLMLLEISFDEENNNFYLSNRLTIEGKKAFPLLLKQAAAGKELNWLITNINELNLLNKTEIRKHPTTGEPLLTKVPVNAADILAESEFNKYYMRAVCRLATQLSQPQIFIYRAKQSSRSRPEHDKLIGTALSPNILLAELRAGKIVDHALGLASPGSGLSVRLP